jgi:hypothetical protein
MQRRARGARHPRLTLTNSESRGERPTPHLDTDQCGEMKSETWGYAVSG